MTNVFLTGAFVLVALFVVMRIVRKGRGRSYAESKKAFEERLRKTGEKTRDHSLSAEAAEQMLPIAAAVRELLELAGHPPGFALLETGRTVRLQSPSGEIRIDFGLSHTHMARRHKSRQSRMRWRVKGPDAEAWEYMELADTVAHLKRIIFRQNERSVFQP